FNPTHQKHLHKDGSYVALSNDDAKTWTIKRLPANVLTVGYTTATQGPDGVIHVVTSKNKVNYEIELNEAWILDKSAGDSQTPAGDLTHVQLFTERYPNGKTKATWSAGRAADGRVLLEGAEHFFYPSGKPMWTVSFHAGEKTGEERYQREDGTPIWVKTYAADGTWTWDNFDEEGKRTATSHWRGKTLLSSDVPDGPFDKVPGADKLPPPPGE
ncbi:MAG TPA: sialidase family protein, partial [Edaphobacter sp.]|nr:sialidase family protein [Edaphobacter sp.]